jgi:5-methylcytosine-specific restriction endonuclease McrA
MLERERERRAEYRDSGDERYEAMLAKDTAKNHARRDWLREHPSDVTKAEIAKMKRSAKVCALCRKPLSDDWSDRHLDHIVPRFAGGTHTLDNVRILCVACNCSRPKDASDVSGFQMNLWMVPSGS